MPWRCHCCSFVNVILTYLGLSVQDNVAHKWVVDTSEVPIVDVGVLVVPMDYSLIKDGVPYDKLPSEEVCFNI